MIHDTMADALSVIENAEHKSRKTCSIHPSSKVLKSVLEIMNKHGYIGQFTETETAQGPMLTVELLGSLNKCGAVKPRFSVKNKNFEKYEKKYLPAKEFGHIVVSTPQGIMTHSEAKKKSIGGRLIAYFY